MDKEKAPQNYQELNFEQLLGLPETNTLVEEAALDYLKIKDTENFEMEFTGEVDSQGYLIRRDGGPPHVKPSELIISPDAKDLIEMRVKLDLQNQ